MNTLNTPMGATFPSPSMHGQFPMLWQSPSGRDSFDPSQAPQSIPQSRWTPQEHTAFMNALEEVEDGGIANEWEHIARATGKTEDEAKVHAQQYFMKLERERQVPTENFVEDNTGGASKPFMVPQDPEKPDPNNGTVWTNEEARLFDEKLATVPSCFDHQCWHRISVSDGMARRWIRRRRTDGRRSRARCQGSRRRRCRRTTASSSTSSGSAAQASPRAPAAKVRASARARGVWGG